MTTRRSAKNKGRNFEKKIVEILKQFFNWGDDDIRNTASSVNGEDIILSENAYKEFPFSIESKKQERLNIWSAIDQAEKNAGDKTALVVFSKNNKGIYVVVDFYIFLDMWRKQRKLVSDIFERIDPIDKISYIPEKYTKFYTESDE